MPQTNIAGKASLKVVTPGYDPKLLTELLNHVTSNPVEVAENTITFDEADGAAIREMLAEVGVETTDAEPVTAEPAAAAPAADPATDPAAEPAPVVDPAVSASAAPAIQAAAPVAAADTGSATADPVAAEPAAGTDPADPAAPALDPAAAAQVSQEELLQQVETELNASGSYQGVLCGSGEKASWLLVSGNGKPVARIRLAAQAHASTLAGVFAKSDYFDMLKASFDKHGFAKTLANCNADVFTDSEVSAPEMPDVEAAVTAGVDRYRKCLSMAFAASAKNLVGNPMKAKLFDILTANGVENPTDCVEEVFAEFEPMADQLDDKAAEYMDMDESGLSATSKMLASMGVQHPQGSGKLSATATRMRASLVAGNLPLTAALPTEPTPVVAGAAPTTGAPRELIQAAVRRL